MQPNQQNPTQTDVPPPQSSDNPPVVPAPTPAPSSAPVFEPATSPVSQVPTGYNYDSQPQPTQSGAADFLHLEPIADPAIAAGKKKKRLIIIAGVVTSVVTLAVAGAFLYLYIQQNTPQEKFYTALDKLMQTSYISRNYILKNTKSSAGEVITADTNSDFSNPSAPKSTLSFNDKDTKQTITQGNLTVLDSQQYYARILQIASF